MNETEKQDF